jgi:hypothetical protein
LFRLLIPRSNPRTWFFNDGPKSGPWLRGSWAHGDDAMRTDPIGRIDRAALAENLVINLPRNNDRIGFRICSWMWSGSP